jgi:hypothetical protein
MRTHYAIDKKQRKHDMLLTFLANAHAGKKQQQLQPQRKRPAPVNIKSMILLLLGTV